MNRKSLIIVFAFALYILLFSCSGSNEEYNILKYGAVGDSATINTEAIQQAIDDCAKKGGKVIVPEGDFVSGTLWLRSNVELHIENGGSLFGSVSLEDYSEDVTGAIEAPAFNKCFIFAENAENIKITGEGIINGRGQRENFPVKTGDTLAHRPMLIRFVECNNILLSGISLKNSASWCTHMVDCDSIVVNNVTIDNHVNVNNDGFDLDGCKNILIENCNIRSGDDAICAKSTTTRLTENMVVKNCRITSNTAAFKCGTSSRGGFRNIHISDCDFSDTQMGVIKLLLVDGGILEDIHISDITMNNVEGPIFIRLGNRGRLYEKPTEQIYEQKVSNEGAPLGSVKNITIKNISGSVVSDVPKRCGMMISGVPGHYIENILLENIDLTFPGGGTREDAVRIVPEDESRYPEQFFFGTLPSWGAYIRHARDVTFRNVNIRTREEDKRKRLVLVDTENFVEE